jgi:hypothetical protein
MPSTVSLKVEGLDKLTQVIRRTRSYLSPAVLASRTMKIADEAGEALLAASVRACIEEIYDQPEMTYIRTMALLDAHEVITSATGPEFFIKYVTIDPEAPVGDQDHPGRELVIDYAGYVHNGYTQWVWGFNSGQFTPGKFWFDVALQESYPMILAFVRLAFTEMITLAIREIVA